MFRKYLLTIHRFLFRNIEMGGSLENTTMVIAMLTFASFLIWLESLTKLNLISGRLSIMLLGIPIFVVFFPIIIWYNKNPPSVSELSNGKDQYTGIILFLISLILVFFFKA